MRYMNILTKKKKNRYIEEIDNRNEVFFPHNLVSLPSLCCTIQGKVWSCSLSPTDLECINHNLHSQSHLRLLD